MLQITTYIGRNLLNKYIKNIEKCRQRNKQNFAS